MDTVTKNREWLRDTLPMVLGFARRSGISFPEEWEMDAALMADRMALANAMRVHRRAHFLQNNVSSLTGSVLVTPTIGSGGYTNTVTGLGVNPISSPLSTGTPTSFTNGTGVNQCNQVYFIQDTLAASSYARTYTFTGSSLLDMFGNGITFARIRVLFLQLLTNTAAVSITIGNATHPVPIVNSTGTFTLNNGAQALFCDPGSTAYVTTVGSTDQIKVVNNDGALQAVFNMMAMGSTA